MRKFILICLVLSSLAVSSQPNCEAYKWKGDTLKCEACHIAEQRAGLYQFSREYQEVCDRSLAVDSTFGYAYKVKSTAYFKSGDMINAMALMEKAVAINPKEYLGYRAWCRYQFFGDYLGAIADIEALDAMVDYDIGPAQTGDYHLQVTRALCYKAINQQEKAIEIIKTEISKEDYYQGLYDYLHLGVLYLEIEAYEKALAAFQIQSDHQGLAETDYYQAMTYKALGRLDDARASMLLAKEKYNNQISMHEVYTHHIDKVFRADIERELNFLE